MKKLAVLFIAVVILALAGCSIGSIGEIDKAAKIEVLRYDKSSGEETGAVTVTDETGIGHIVDNLNSLKLKKMKYNEPTVLEYKLTFYSAEGDTLEIISIAAHDWLGFDGYFHSIVRGELDREYIAGLFK